MDKVGSPSLTKPPANRVEGVCNHLTVHVNNTTHFMWRFFNWMYYIYEHWATDSSFRQRRYPKRLRRKAKSVKCTLGTYLATESDVFDLHKQDSLPGSPNRSEQLYAMLIIWRLHKSGVQITVKTGCRSIGYVFLWRIYALVIRLHDEGRLA